MPANNRQPAVQTPASPGPKPPTAKYTNKDGTKSITIPKSSASTPPAQPSPTAATLSKGAVPADLSASAAAANDALAPMVNRKKQKRRAKAAAKAAAAAEEAAVTHELNGLPSPPASTVSTHTHHAITGAPRKNVHNHQHAPEGEPQPPAQNGDSWDDDETESDDDHQLFAARTNVSSPHSKAIKKKKKQRDALGTSIDEFAREMGERSAGISRDEKIWNTSSAEERERIKQFWLGLGEDERKSLVKVEKDAVLKKMKEQQKHTCSCTVCGRKRTAIEEELEGLYDAYYEELESFANQPHSHPNGPPMLGTPRRLGQMSGLHPPRGIPSNYSNHHPSRARIVEHIDNDDDDDEDEDEDEDDVDDEGYSEEDDLDEDDEGEPEDIPEDNALDLFNFGQSLTVQGMRSQLSCFAYAKYLSITTLGGILTVADDLLKNDGKKFIEMMEQLAERRMAREEDAKDHYAYGHSNGASMTAHNHAPPPDDEEYDEEDEDDEEYDSGEEEYDEEEVTISIWRVGGFAKSFSRIQ